MKVKSEQSRKSKCDAILLNILNDMKKNSSEGKTLVTGHVEDSFDCIKEYKHFFNALRENKYSVKYSIYNDFYDISW
jgi:hypothetical protein